MEIILKYFSDFTEKQIFQFSQLAPLYKDWNEKINVISRKDIDSLYEKHVLHSLSISAVFDFPPGCEVLDLGTGGGFPGLPLAIFFPEVKFHLVDSIAKKLKVVSAIAEEIGVKNISVQHSRVEEIKNRRVDYVISRAVAPLGDLWKWSKPVLRTPAQKTAGVEHPGLVCLKGGDLAAEIQQSGTRPRIVELTTIFPEPYFEEKFMLFIPR